MRQIEYTQRLPYYLEAHTAGPMIAGSVEFAYALYVGRRNILSLVVSVEGFELVALEGPVHIDVQLYILISQRSDAEAYLQSVVAHLAEVGQQVVVSKWRNGHGVVVEHIGGARGVEVGRKYNSAVPEGHIQPHVEGALYLPLQVGIGVAYEA